MAPANGSEPTELIYLPSASAAPVIVAAGIAFLAAGTFMGWFLWLVGAFLLFLGARSWWRTSDDEISRMRREQHTDTAVLPADPIPARTPRS
jgi:hypothetical protein